MFSTHVMPWMALVLGTKDRTTMTTVEKPQIVTPADWVPGPKQGRWTYDDYVALPEDGNRYEIVNGVLYMTPDRKSVV